MQPMQVSDGFPAEHRLNFAASLPLASSFHFWLRVSDLAWHRAPGGARGRLSAKIKAPPCSKRAGKLPVLKRGCLPEEHNKGRSGCKAGTARLPLPPRGPQLVNHLQDEGGEDAVGLAANTPPQQPAPRRSLCIWR